jgi:hypothetical protein
MKINLSQLKRLISENTRSVLNEVKITASDDTGLYGEGETVAASTDGYGNVTIDGSQGMKTYALTSFGGTVPVKIDAIVEKPPAMPTIKGEATVPMLGKKSVEQKLDQEVADKIIDSYTKNQSPFTIEGKYTITFTDQAVDIRAESSREPRGKT